MDEHRKAMQSAYVEAVKRLKETHLEEFRAILYQVYAERGMDVKQRRTRKQIEADRIAEAKALLAKYQITPTQEEGN